ncbi:MAG TPA: hypothetical protein PKM73_16855 [Verrucomicrobiota bacterium]|nr:hypothetical protein [Verrucomicrobiota bacterium]HNU52125.1 hypothetical protein [Verrucomicrobiota bacterium]
MNMARAILSWMAAGVVLLQWLAARAGEERITIEREAWGRTPPIHISLEGYSGEVERVLQFDLEIAGFKVVGSGDEKLQYALKGGGGSVVEGRLQDAIKKSELFAKAYSGGGARTQAHALSDDVVLAVTGKPGVARTKIAFKITRGQDSEVYLADYDGFNAVAVTQDRTVVAAPCWRPGHRMLFYTTYKSGNPDIVSHDLGSGVRRTVARYSGSNISPAVSPDGQHVAMILSKSGSPDLFVANVDGTGLRQLTQTPEDESSPTWSPDGGWVCFATRIDGRRTLARIPAGGGSMRRIATSGVLNPTEPDWSPDGKTIAFTSQMGGFQICLVEAGGGEAKLLVSGEDPCWAGNSRTLIYTKRGSGGRRSLSLLDVLTKQSKDIPINAGTASQPSWAR